MTEYNYITSEVATGGDAYGNMSSGVPSVLGTGPNGWFCIKRHIDLSVAGDLLTSTGAFGAADILNLVNVYEGMLVMGVAIEVTTVEGATLAATIGDGDDADGFLVAADLNSATWQHGYTQTTYAADYCDGTTYHNGRLYTSADTIDLTLSTASADVAVLDVYVYGVDFRPVA